MPCRFEVGLFPAVAVLQVDSPVSSEYPPSPVQSPQVLRPPAEALPIKQSSHSVSVVEELTVLMYLPAPQVDAAVQPKAPADEVYFPSVHSAHSVAPPTENRPAGHSATSVWSALGLLPAGAVLHAGKPSASEYSPSLSQSWQSVLPPREAEPLPQRAQTVSEVIEHSDEMYFPAPQEEQVRHEDFSELG